MVPRDPAPRTQHAHYPHWHQARFARRPRHDREAQGEANGPHRLPPGPPARQGDQRRQVPRVLCPDTEGSQGEKKKIVLIFHLLLTHDSPLSRTCLMRPSEQSLAPPHAPRPRRAACFCNFPYYKFFKFFSYFFHQNPLLLSFDPCAIFFCSRLVFQTSVSEVLYSSLTAVVFVFVCFN